MTFKLRPPYRVEEIVVTASTMNSPAVPAVTLEVEGERVSLYPDDARRLATALLAHAAAAEADQPAWP